MEVPIISSEKCFKMFYIENSMHDKILFYSLEFNLYDWLFFLLEILYIYFSKGGMSKNIFTFTDV